MAPGVASSCPASCRNRRIDFIRERTAATTLHVDRQLIVVAIAIAINDENNQMDSLPASAQMLGQSIKPIRVIAIMPDAEPADDPTTICVRHDRVAASSEMSGKRVFRIISEVPLT